MKICRKLKRMEKMMFYFYLIVKSNVIDKKFYIDKTYNIFHLYHLQLSTDHFYYVIQLIMFIKNSRHIRYTVKDIKNMLSVCFSYTKKTKFKMRTKNV
jgi:hypothetical protein